MKLFNIKIFIIIFLLNMCLFGLNKIEALKKKLIESSELKRSEIYNNIAAEYFTQKKWEMFFHYSKKSLTSAEKYNQIEQIIDSLINIGRYYVKNKNLKSAEHMINRAFIIASKSKNRDYLYKVLNEQVLFYWSYKKDLKVTLKICKRLENIFKKEKNFRKQAIYIHYQGNIYLSLKNIEKSIEYINKALILYKKAGDKTRVVQMLTYLGIRYQKLGKNKKGLFFLKEAEKEVKKIKKLSHIHLRVLFTYKNYYKRVKKYNLAIKYLDKGIELALKKPKDFKFRFRLLEFLSNKARILIEQEKFMKADSILEKSILFKKSDPSWVKKKFILDYKFQKGIIKLKRKEYKNAIQLFSNIFQLLKIEYGEKGVAEVYKYYAESFMGLKEYKRTEKFLKKSLDIAKKYRNIFLIKELYLLFSDLYKKKNILEKSIKYKNLSDELNIEK